MVQLKVGRCVYLDWDCYISIPHGTIKSFKKAAKTAPAMSFQYLMVQLKESSRTNRFYITEISIPHGTIKSLIFRKQFYTLTEFQYLMVQLKVRMGLFDTWKIRNFNTSWYN